MLTHFLRYGCVALLFSCIIFPLQAEVYKWVDDDGQIHYSQTPPAQQEAIIVKTQKGPKTTPEQSSQAVEQLINEQEQRQQEQASQQQQQMDARQQAEMAAKNCQIAKDNLQQYLDNPNTRIKQDDGTVVRIDEDERQKRIKEYRRDINTFCQ